MGSGRLAGLGKDRGEVGHGGAAGGQHLHPGLVAPCHIGAGSEVGRQEVAIDPRLVGRERDHDGDAVLPELPDQRVDAGGDARPALGVGNMHIVPGREQPATGADHDIAHDGRAGAHATQRGRRPIPIRAARRLSNGDIDLRSGATGKGLFGVGGVQTGGPHSIRRVRELQLAQATRGLEVIDRGTVAAARLFHPPPP